MADEDALFAEFMGEIKSTVVAAEPQVAAAGEDSGAVSDTASVGDASAGNGNGVEKKDVDTTKRKGGAEVKTP